MDHTISYIFSYVRSISNYIYIYIYQFLLLVHSFQLPHIVLCLFLIILAVKRDYFELNCMDCFLLGRN